MELKTNPAIQRTMRILKTASFILALFVILTFFMTFSAFFTAKLMGPPPIEVPQSTIFYSADGKVIGEKNLGGKRYWAELEDISPHLINATLAIEDQRFYSHIGFDAKRIFGAVWADLKALAKVQGASTISQQYARNLFLSPEKTWKRKLKEALYTIRLEANYSKDEILEGYLNTIYFGHGAYGVEAASHFYFQKSAADLNVAEAALLAGIPKGPGSFSPILSWENAKNRQELILSVMAGKGIISEEEAKRASREDLAIIGFEKENPTVAPYFQEVVKAQLQTQIGLDERTIALGGLKVYTTLDSDIQGAAEKAFSDVFPEQSAIQGALIAMDPQTGYVKALIGGRDYEKSSFNRALQALRQPGSIIKPILYYAALEKGFTPATKFRSEPTQFTFDDGRKTYTPQNFNHKYADGDITMIQAIALSDNIYAVKTHLFLGMDTLADYAKKFGIQSDMEAVPSLALGTSGVRLIEMANAYSHFANGGYSVKPVFISRVEDPEGNTIYEHKEERARVLDKDQTFVMNHLLTGVFDRTLNSYATVTGQTVIDKITRIYAGKSGSTDTDSWMVGYTPKLVTAVWTGYDMGKKVTRADERQFAKHIWADFMEEVLVNEPVHSFQPTDGVTGIHIDPASGLLATENCPAKRYTYFIQGTEPTEFCTEHLPGEDAMPESKEGEGRKEMPWYKKWFDWFN